MTDELLVHGLMQRDESALEQIQKQYGTYCLGIANRILHRREDAEECVADALQKLWETIPPERPARLKYYFARITRNIALNRRKADHRQKRGNGEFAEIYEELAYCIDASQSPEAELEAKQLEEAINRFLDSLPDKERNLFLRRYFFMDELASIAERYQISKGQISVILFRAREKLKKYLLKEGLL